MRPPPSRRLRDRYEYALCEIDEPGRLEYPHSLSYHATTFTWVPSTTDVSDASIWFLSGD